MSTVTSPRPKPVQAIAHTTPSGTTMIAPMNGVETPVELPDATPSPARRLVRMAFFPAAGTSEPLREEVSWRRSWVLTTWVVVVCVFYLWHMLT